MQNAESDLIRYLNDKININMYKIEIFVSLLFNIGHSDSGKRTR